MQTKIIERYFFFGLLLATFIFTFFIFRPFWIVLVLGISFSIVLYPIYLWLKKRKLSNWLASLLTVLFFIIVLCIPIFSIGYITFNQSQDLYNSYLGQTHFDPTIGYFNEKINSILPSGISFDINQKMTAVVSWVTGSVTQIFKTMLSAFLSFVLILFTIFYFLKDGEKWRSAFIKLSPLSDNNDKKIADRLSKTISGVVRGCLFVTMAQGILLGLGYTIFGVPNSALWGLAAGVASLVPFVGTALVSIPIIIFLFMKGFVVKSILMLVWAFAMNILIDNFLSPYIIGKKINIPPFLILFSVLGGISLLGPVGILIGPLSVSLLYTLISIYRNEYQVTVIDNKNT